MVKIQDIKATGRFKERLASKSQLEGKQLLAKDVAQVTGINAATLSRFDQQKSFDVRHVYALMKYFDIDTSGLEELFDFQPIEPTE